MAAYSVILCEDSSSILWIRPLSSLLWFLSTVSRQTRLPWLQEIRLHCFSVDSSTVAYKAWLYAFYLFTFRFILAWKGSCCVDCLSDRLSLPLLLFFVVAYKAWLYGSLCCYFVWGFILNFMDSSIVFFVVVLSTVSGQIRLPWLQEIRLHCFSVDSSTVAHKAWLYGSFFCYFVLGFVLNLYGFMHCFSLLWFYPLIQGRFIYPNYRRFVSIVFVWIRPLWLIKLGFMAFLNLHNLDLFWHKKEAAASTVCLTGFPCHFFWFFPWLVFC